MKCFSREADEGLTGNARSGTSPVWIARRGRVFSVSLSFEQGQAAISIWAELKPTHLNLVIFLGAVQGTKERQW